MRLRVTGLPILFGAFFVILSGSYAWGPARQANPGQQTAASTGDEQSALRFNADTTLVLIPATVTDPLNRFVLGLQKQDFHLFEDGAEQTIAHFSGEDAPLSIGLVFDTSGSMGDKLRTGVSTRQGQRENVVREIRIARYGAAATGLSPGFLG